MKFGFSIENTSGYGKLKSILRKSHIERSKNTEIIAVFGELEIGKLSWVYLSTNANEIWFQHKKYFGPVQVEVHFAKIAFWASRGPKTPKFSPFLLNWRSASCLEFISQPIPMKFDFSIENSACENCILGVQKDQNSNYWLIAKRWIASHVELPPPSRCLTVSTLF